ncbi:MAG: GGDEF domain-containing protein [Myxococcales bacterium]|nr:GGDEF domain-containing protein [Myxococcales bacterium]
MSRDPTSGLRNGAGHEMGHRARSRFAQRRLQLAEEPRVTPVDDRADLPEFDTRLAAVNAALDAGQVDRARELAQSMLAAVRGVDPRAEARALVCLAHCDRVGSRLRRASEAARRAAQLYEQLGDTEGEAWALTTLAHVTMLLGRNDEAVEAALLCVRLCDTKVSQPLTVIAYNCLGLAYCWSGDHDRADAALDTAVRTARRCVPAVSIYQPRLNQVWVEASRLIDERYQTGGMKNLTRLGGLMAECRELERSGDGLSVLPGLQALARTISSASSGLLAAWQGDLAAARTAVDAARRSLSESMTWLDAFVRWAAAELAWARQDWAGAERELTEMRQMASAVEHEQLASRAHLLLAQVYELQGKHVDARRAYRALRQRERRVMTEGLESRESLVAWRLGARQSERHLEQALVASKQFERWSLEDALTGIANRRHFEQSLARRLPAAIAADRPLTVAMVDVDRFKSVNDRFTHLVGDRVLKTVAAIVASEVRENDLPARWAGDEFVILFDDATEPMARHICDRIRAAVVVFDWEAIAHGLRVSISIGTGEVMPGDTAESVLQRSDESMYRTKSVAPVPVN